MSDQSDGMPHWSERTSDGSKGQSNMSGRLLNQRVSSEDKQATNNASAMGTKTKEMWIGQWPVIMKQQIDEYVQRTVTWLDWVGLYKPSVTGYSEYRHPSMDSSVTQLRWDLRNLSSLCNIGRDLRNGKCLCIWTGRVIPKDTILHSWNPGSWANLTEQFIQIKWLW